MLKCGRRNIKMIHIHIIPGVDIAGSSVILSGGTSSGMIIIPPITLSGETPLASHGM
jgi:hypothetical protein